MKKEITDIVVPAERLENLPQQLVNGLQQCFSLFETINSFEDLERRFLQGQGLSPHTYKSYLAAVKQFYTFTEGKHPLQAIAGDVEAWFDDMLAKSSRATAYLRIRGLKKFFEGIRAQLPFYETPFDMMSEKCRRKLNRPPKPPKAKALTKSELRRLLLFIVAEDNLKARQTESLILFLVTTGLRAAELCGLLWQDLEQDEESGRWFAQGIGKGSVPFYQEIADPSAVQKAHAVHRELFGRAPTPDQHVFHSLPNYHGKEPAPMNPNVLWTRISELGKKAQRAGIVKRELTWSPHLFRRTYATLLLKAGMDIRAVQQQTRHKSIETLAKHYLDSSVPATAFFAEILATA